MCLQAFFTSLSTKACKSSCRAPTLLQYCFIRHREFLKSIKTKPKAITYRRSSGERMAMKPYHWDQGDTLTEIVPAVDSKRGNHCCGKKGEEIHHSAFQHLFRHESTLPQSSQKGLASSNAVTAELLLNRGQRAALGMSRSDVQKTHPNTHQALCLGLSCITLSFRP